MVRSRVRSVNMPPMQQGLAPLAYATQFRQGAPRMQSRGKDITISHSELFQDHRISVVGAFDVYSTLINPGNPSMFPWLSPIALRYEKYKFTNLVFKYFSRSTTSNYGMVGCYVDHDPTDPLPADFKECCAQYGNSVTQIYMPMTSPVDLRRDNMPLRFVRDGSSKELDGDPKLFDVGQLVTYSDNTSYASNNVCGYWVVDYTIELSIPQIQDGAGGKFVPSDLSDPIGTLQPTGHARQNFHKHGLMEIMFDAPFEGTVEVQETTAMNSISRVPELAVSGGPLGGALEVIGECFSTAAPGAAIVTYALKAATGTRISFSQIAPDLATFVMCLAKGAYDQYTG